MPISIKPVFISFALLAAVFQAAAQQPPSPRHVELKALGKSLKLTAPDGYCWLGTRPGDVTAAQLRQGNLAPGQQVPPVEAAARCNVLDAYRRGKREDLGDMFVVTAVLTRSGLLTPETRTRQQLVQMIAGPSGASTLGDNAAFQQRVRASFRKELAPQMRVSVLGFDDMAAYTRATMQASSAAGPVEVNALSAVTVVQQVGLTFTHSVTVTGSNVLPDAVRLRKLVTAAVLDN